MLPAGSRAVDLGWADMSPEWAYAKRAGTWILTYHAGPRALEKGAAIRVYPPFTFDARHNSCVRWGLGTLSVGTEADAEIKLQTVDTMAGNPLAERYSCDIIELQVCSGAVKGGDSIRLVLGDQREGGEAAVAQWLSGPDMPFVVAVKAAEADDFEELARYPLVKVLGGPTERLLCAPDRSTAAEGDGLSFRIRAMDAHTNTSSLYQHALDVSAEDGVTVPDRAQAMDLADQGLKTMDGFVMNKPGTHRIRISDGEREAVSAPVSTEFTKDGEHIYWGEIHAHSEISDGLGSAERYYDYARNEVWLDFCALGDHGGGDAFWGLCVDAARDFDEPGRFVALLGYEWRWKVGHGNVYGIDLDLPVHADDEREALFELVRAGKAIIIPHHTNDPLMTRAPSFQWDLFDRDLIHAAEICQMRGSFEKDELGDHVMFGGFGSSLQSALAKGFKFGFTGGTDNHCGRPASPMYTAFHSAPNVGSANTCDLGDVTMKPTLSGLTAVFAKELTREAVFTAIRSRQTYATTGARILLNFEVNDLRMGQEGPVKGPAAVKVRVAGTAPLKAVTIVRNNEDVKTFAGEGMDQEVAWEDPNPEPGAWYYARVAQTDGHHAWASPVFVQNGLPSEASGE